MSDLIYNGVNLSQGIPTSIPATAPSSLAMAPKSAAPAGSAPGTGKVRKTRPPARKAHVRARHTMIILSFLIFVMAPTVATGVYLWAVAVDQYVSKVGFSVRREDTNSPLEILGGLTSLSDSSSSDTDILYEFIQSQKLVQDMDRDVGLRASWTVPSRDVVFALKQGASIEELLAYWNRMVRISYGAGSGLIEVEVLAFSAQDATKIAQALLEKSSDMINQLSDIARQDSIRYARAELDEAVERLKESRAVVTQFRNENQLVNPEMDLQTQAGLLANLQGQQAQVLIEIDLLSETVNASDPRLEQARRRLRVIETRIEAERQKLGSGSTGTAFADLVGEYERLAVDREFAEKSYVSALATYDGALAESRRKSRYLAAYMQPTEAETAQYPKRMTLLLLVSMFIFLIWAVLVLVVYSVKDRR